VHLALDGGVQPLIWLPPPASSTRFFRRSWNSGSKVEISSPRPSTIGGTIDWQASRISSVRSKSVGLPLTGRSTITGIICVGHDEYAP
jgi:hypothetical protein